ncbi:MAG: divalent-cation tolerance protein CutA [Patescibacteria group bacterium]|nr:divalent-cation tolerance protein CutA [bacterium]MDZ4240944.1 divalent-cation tolerance protein CutA [Patescibacteria group bacterium]
MNTHIIIITTCPNLEESRKLAQGLVQQKLAACVQLGQIESVYRFEGKVEDEKEYRLYIKTKRDLFDQVKEYILLHHSYKLPQIVAISIVEGFDKYLQWIDANTAESIQ